MLKAYETPEDEPVPPECCATVDRIQTALDGASADLGALDADPHPATCPTCRERVRAARVLLSVLAAPAEPAPVPAGFADRVVKAAQADRHAQTRSRVYKVTALLALAAAVLVAVFAILYKPQPESMPVPKETVQTPEVAPAPREKTPNPAPEPRPLNLGNEFAKAGQAVLDAPKPLTDSVAVAPKVFDVLSSSFKLPAAPIDPMGTALDPARKSLTELPGAAREGFEPVTGTAEKAFNRFLRDVGSVKPNS
jgi:hypothetical protein